jgi:hypothetical protein
MEMACLGKPKAGFPKHLEIANAIPTFPQVRRRFTFTRPAETEAEAEADRTTPARGARLRNEMLPDARWSGYNYLQLSCRAFKWPVLK